MEYKQLEKLKLWYRNIGLGTWAYTGGAGPPSQGH